MIAIAILVVLEAWQGPDVPMYGGFGIEMDVDQDHRIDLFDFAHIQIRWECDGQFDVVRPMGVEGCGTE